MIEHKPTQSWIDKTPLTIVNIGEFRFCLEYRSIEIQGQEIELTAKEFDILALLILNPRRVFTYEMITDIVWKEEYDVCSKKTIINHISNLRRKLKTIPEVAANIKSVRSIGYKFDLAV